MLKFARALGPSGFGTYEIDWQSDAIFGDRVERSAQELVVPGFVDQHMHGAFGIDFMSASSADLTALCNKLASHGYEEWLPTTVTAPVSSVSNALSHLPAHPMIAGFHLEGPFISSQFPGAQPKEHILSPPIGASEWDEILEDPRLRIVTLAPEIPNALELISKLRNRGVIVSIGHSNATHDECRTAFEFGASQMTHFYNAMRPYHHREPGCVGYGWLQDNIDVEIIYDLQHVDKQALQLLMRVKPIEKIIAVSDSTMASGMPANQFIEMWGHKCEILKKRVQIATSGALAGSKILLLDAFRNLSSDFGEEIAILLCALNPRRRMHLSSPPRHYNVFNSQLEITEQMRRTTTPNFISAG